MKNYFYLVLFLVSSWGYGKTSPYKADLIINEPGTELFTVFGHGALRIYQENTPNDFVYNFGVIQFNFNTYLEFILHGDVYSKISKVSYRRYHQRMQVRQQGYTRYNLNIKERDVLEIDRALNDILRGSNKILHDFYTENCIIILHKFLRKYNNTPLPNDLDSYTDLTYRSITNTCTKDFPWISLYLNLVSGPGTDKKLHISETLFLPKNYIAYLKEKTALIGKTKIFKFSLKIKKTIFSPWVLFGFLFVVSLGIKIFEIRKGTYFLWLDKLVFTGCFLLGNYLLFVLTTNQMGFGGNINVLWANPLLILPLIHDKYLNLTKYLYAICLLFWGILILLDYQQIMYLYFLLISMFCIRLFFRKATIR